MRLFRTTRVIVAPIGHFVGFCVVCLLLVPGCVDEKEAPVGDGHSRDAASDREVSGSAGDTSQVPDSATHTDAFDTVDQSTADAHEVMLPSGIYACDGVANGTEPDSIGTTCYERLDCYWSWARCAEVDADWSGQPDTVCGLGCTCIGLDTSNEFSTGIVHCEGVDGEDATWTSFGP